MVDWQITATTIYCEAVDDEVTIMVNKDKSVACTGYNKYAKPTGEVSKLLKQKSRHLNRSLECEGLDCHRVVGYRDRLFAEESGVGRDEAGGD